MTSPTMARLLFDAMLLLSAVAQPCSTQWLFCRSYIHTYIHTYNTYMHACTYIHTSRDINTYIHTYIRPYISSPGNITEMGWVWPRQLPAKLSRSWNCLYVIAYHHHHACIPRHLNTSRHDSANCWQVADAFMLVVLDGFNNPRSFHTFRAESVFEKADWFRQLRSPSPNGRMIFMFFA